MINFRMGNVFMEIRWNVLLPLHLSPTVCVSSLYDMIEKSCVI